MGYARHGSDSPGPLLITLLGMTLVFGGYLLWTGFIEWVDRGTAQNREQEATQQANITATFVEFQNLPTIALFPTNTPVPACQYFTVRGPQAAFVRECPSTNCDDIAFVEADETVCVVGRAPRTDEFPSADDWYEVLLEPDDFLPEISYMNEITLRSNNPTPRPSLTYTPPPTITPVPTRIAPTPTEGTPIPTPTPTIDIDEEEGRTF